MRPIQAVILALLVTAAKADSFADLTSVYAAFAPNDGVTTDGISCEASGNPASCALGGTYYSPDFGVNYDLDIQVSAASSVTAAAFHFINRYPVDHFRNAGWSYLSESAAYGDTIYLSGPAGKPALAEFTIGLLTDPSTVNSDGYYLDFPPYSSDYLCVGAATWPMSWTGSFGCSENPAAVDPPYYTLVQPIILGGPFSFFMHITQGIPADSMHDWDYDAMDITYSIGSIRLLDSNGEPITGLTYSSASGVEYSIEGATHVPEPAAIVLLGTVVLLTGRFIRKRAI